MSQNYNCLKLDALLHLQCIKDLQILPGGNRPLETKTRFITQDITSVIKDLIQCIYLRVSKREKRINRLKFLLKIFKHDIDPDVYQESIRIITGKGNNLFNNSEKIMKPSLDTLKMENEHKNIEGDELIFEKFDITNFKIPEKTIFNNFCKDVLNNDGAVYDVFTYVLIIAFYNILKDTSKLDDSESNFLLKLLLSDATIVFKGGASIGKFLLLNNISLWLSLSNDDKEYVFDNFIKGGDNDTSIHFNVEPDKNYNVDAINAGIERILFEFPVYLKKVINDYKIYDIIQQKLLPINNKTVSYDGRDFTVNSVLSESYAIVGISGNRLQYVPFDSDKKQLYITKTEVTFPNNKGELIKFHLTRIKACFLVTLKNNIFEFFSEFSFNCYAECLDISALCVDSAINYDASYIDANIV